eukprot:scaffold134661_cov37-Attheya_sp.AAC.1
MDTDLVSVSVSIDSKGGPHIDDLVKRIETSFENTTLDKVLKGYEKEENENRGDSDGYSDDNSSTRNDEENEEIPIGGNAAMRAQAMVHSLVSNPHIAESLIINWENPNEGVSNTASQIGGICTACDQAHCDEGGITPQELRTKEWAWHPLGYLNNLHLAPSTEIAGWLPGQNIHNTHQML